MTDAEVFGAAATLGAVAGMRSMTAPMVVSRLAHEGYLSEENPQLELLARQGAVTTTTVLAVGEAIADKTPYVPARTSAGPLFGRLVSGALAGAAVTSGTKRPVLWGAVTGAAAALGATFAAYYLRRAAGQKTGVPDVVFALAEDAIVAASSWSVYKKLRDAAEHLAS
jgi:uncharacterized membrane protein